MKPRFEPRFEWGARAEEAAAVVETREPTLGTLFQEELAEETPEPQAAEEVSSVEYTTRPAGSEPEAPEASDTDIESAKNAAKQKRARKKKGEE